MTSSLHRHKRKTAACGALAAALTLAITGASALGTGQSFTYLDSGFQQELWAVTQLASVPSGDPDIPDFADTVLGGVAFAPNGDVWAAECVLSGTRLHRFRAGTTFTRHATSTLHEEVTYGSGAGQTNSVQTQGGCGLTNHPDGFMYSNSEYGVVKLDANTGLPVAPAVGNPGNALGITVHPVSHHVMYVGADCHPQLGSSAATCTVYDLDPATSAVTTYAQLTKAGTGIEFVDGIYFDPSGDFLFLASRSLTSNALSIVKSPTGLAFPDDSQLVQNVPMTVEPDGVAFYNGATKFVVTLDEASGTMTRFDFPSNNYSITPSQAVFASGGFRGDLLQVGADGCIYGTQGRVFLANDHGARYDNGTETTEDSIVRICSTEPGGGFEVPPGVEQPSTASGRIGDFVWNDLDGDGVQDANEPGLVATVDLRDPTTSAVLATTVSNASGAYEFTGLTLGSYTVAVSTPAGFAPTFAGMGGDPAFDSNASPAGVTLTTAQPVNTTVDFGFRQLGSIAGLTFKDYNKNGFRDGTEPVFPNVGGITLTGAAAGSMATNATGAYVFSNLFGGAYQVGAPATVAGGWTRSTNATYPSPRNVALSPGQNVTGVNFGYFNTNPPVCTVQVFANENPFRGVMTYTAPNGLKSLVVTKNLNNNFTVTVSPANWAVGTTQPVAITGRRVNPAVASQLIAVATDMYGNTVTCDPVVTTLVRDRGREEAETYTDLPYEESMVSIENYDPGLRGIDVIVNGTMFRVRGLKDNETRDFSIKSAMQPGNNNTVVLIARGRPGGSAQVTIAEPTRRVRLRR